MKKSENRTKDVRKVLSHLVQTGVRPEQMAIELDVSYGAIKTWMAGRRHPKTPTIRQIEHIYGVKIL